MVLISVFVTVVGFFGPFKYSLYDGFAFVIFVWNKSGVGLKLNSVATIVLKAGLLYNR